MYDYAKATYNSPNPLRRFSHRTRLKISLDLLQLQASERVLDYGCGNGFFLAKLSELYPKNEIQGYEPYPNIYHQQLSNQIFNTKEALFATDKKYDKIICLEVLEHCCPQVQQKIVAEFATLLHENGRVLISVPIENGAVALVKNMMRFRLDPARRLAGYSFKNIARSVFSLPIPEYRNQDIFLTHMGFYFSDLEKILLQHFDLEKKVFSPLTALNHTVNSQVFYILKKK